MKRVFFGIGVGLLLLQVAAIVYARFVPSRYFCWAPFDMQTDYELEVHVNDQPLSAKQIVERYKRPAKGTDNRSYHHLIDIITGVEESYHPDDAVHVVMTYRVNGTAPRQWTFQRP